MAASLSEQFSEVMIAKARAQEAVGAMAREDRTMIECLLMDLDVSIAGDLRGARNAFDRVRQLAQLKQREDARKQQSSGGIENG
jgi:hypothetical protein